MDTEIRDIKTATITEKGQICIPQDARDRIGLKRGSKVSMIIYKDRVELRPMKQISDKLYPALISEDSLSKKWNTREEDEAWKNL
jgi:AbrB family looped-hinge helix DNA binding protein